MTHTHTHKHTLGRTLWTRDRTVAETVSENTQHSQGPNVHYPKGIRTHKPTMRTVAGPFFRRRDHRNRLECFDSFNLNVYS